MPDFIETLGPVLAIDFEAVPGGDIFHIGAILGNQRFERQNIKDVRAALKDLSDFGKNARYILGHNILDHDLNLARQQVPDLPVLRLPVIDTLFLSPLAFPENPYHKLVKDYKLVKSGRNDPLADARLALAVFGDQVAAFEALTPGDTGLFPFYAFAFEGSGRLAGIFDFFFRLAGFLPDKGEAKDIFLKFCRDKICSTALDEIWDGACNDPGERPVLAYALAWLRVCGGNSVLPPWVKHRFPGIRELLGRLRYACSNEACAYCRSTNDSEKLLKKYFGFDRYRAIDGGRVLQKEIIDAGLGGDSLLGILPTGGGKSICYQIPALHRYERTGDLTIVISPLKALMKDQVDNLNRALGMEAAGAVNGSLTLPERGEIMEKVRLGDIGILYISPEQLRNYSVADLIGSREVGCWVFDEAHCLSKWGHDFRPDYLNVSDFILSHSRGSGRPPLVGAFTATAKQDVVEEICSHFKEKLDLDLTCLMSGVQRKNLNFQVWPVTRNEKYDVVFTCLKESFADGGTGAIVYCASRKGTENLSEFLNEKGIEAQAFHAGRSEPDKRNIQDEFVDGKIPVICATNAFGMGIDKKDIRLVVHADIPGSLENYLQEAGRAGRDMAPSDCILLYEQEDIENQFSLNAYSRLSIKDIKKILALLKKRGAKTPEIVITPGEIMRLIGYTDTAEDDARARIGVSWLERKGFLARSFNQTLFFKGKPLVRDMAEAEKKLAGLNLSQMTAAVYRRILTILFNADKDGVLSADTICTGLGSIKDLPDTYMDSRVVMGLLSEMAEIGLIKEGVVMTAFVRPKGRGSSPRLLASFLALEKEMLSLMEELSPDASNTDRAEVINLRLMSQRLKDRGFEQANTDIVEKILRALAADKGESRGRSLKISGRKGRDLQRVFVKFPWQKIRERMTLRHHCAGLILASIISALPKGLQTGQAQVTAEFFLSNIVRAMGSDVFLSSYQGEPKALIERSLLFMHDMKVITLQNGLGVFRQAYTLTMNPDSRKRRYTKGDYEPLSLHYAQKNVQVHVMEKYARLGLEKIKTALGFVSDYFSSSYDLFINRHFPGEKRLIQTAMTAEAYKKIIQSLENHTQESIVAAPPEKNILVLAGPGSGKTRTIVHRCAWLIKAKSVDPASILVLCFNHQAMIELRKRIRALAGRRAGRVTAMTYHGFAMRLTGRSFMEKGPKTPPIGFDAIIDEAVAILNGERDLAGIDPSEAREYLLARYRYVLVDEYQDIDQRQYGFISALTGRLAQDRDTAISIMAVGDDDQSIYGFRDANVKFIQEFKTDYKADLFYMVENYRSSHPLIRAANFFISRNHQRMKTAYPIRINAKRKSLELPPEKSGPDSLVRMVAADDIASQAVFTAREIKRLTTENPGMGYDDIAVVSRQGIHYPFLVSLRMALAKEGIPFCYSLKTDSGFPLFRIREIQAFIQYLSDHGSESRTPADLRAAVQNTFLRKNSWTDHISQILDAWCAVNSDLAISVDRAREFALETLLEDRQEQKTGTGVFLGTAHSIKGMEFPAVFILDGGWHPNNIEEERRLFYVAMTRAKDRLYVCGIKGSENPHLALLSQNEFVHHLSAEPIRIDGFKESLTVSILGMEDLFLSWAGQFPKGHWVHAALAGLAPMDKVRILEKGPHIFVETRGHGRVARLSAKGRLKWQNRIHTIVGARVLGMVIRRKTDGEGFEGREESVESWEIPIVEILHIR